MPKVGTRRQTPLDACVLCVLLCSLGKIWKALDPEDKEQWRIKADEAKLKHERDHPGYKYQPRRKADKDAGKVPDFHDFVTLNATLILTGILYLSVSGGTPVGAALPSPEVELNLKRSSAASPEP